MIVDSSAIVAIMLREPGHEDLIERLGNASQISIGAPTLVETAIVLSARLRRDARGALARLLQELGIEVIPFTTAHFGVAVQAWLSYGRGRHRAKSQFRRLLDLRRRATGRRSAALRGRRFSTHRPRARLTRRFAGRAIRGSDVGRLRVSRSRTRLASSPPASQKQQESR